MPDKKQYASVSELVRDIVPDEEFHAAFDEFVARRKLTKQLVALRAARGMSQEDVAAKMACTQSRISKLENAEDDDVRLGDLRAYAEAVGCELVACPIPQDITSVERVKCHTVTIKKHTDDLAQLARTDETIAEGVASFFFELFANFIWVLGDSAKQLPLRSDGAPRIRVEAKFGVTGEGGDDPAAPCCDKPTNLLEAAP